MSTIDEELQRVEKLFQDWRDQRKKRSPVPKELWEEAFELSKKMAPYRVSQCLRVNYSTLKKMIESKAEQTRFSEIRPASIAPKR